MPTLQGQDVLNASGRPFAVAELWSEDSRSSIAKVREYLPDIRLDPDEVDQAETRLSKRRIHNVPMINMVILSVFAYFLVRLSFRYHRLYTKSSLVATVCTNLVLFGIADTLAQSIAAYYALDRVVPTVRSPTIDAYEGPDGPFVDLGDMEQVYDVESQPQDNRAEIVHATRFIFKRFAAFMNWGFMMAFCQVLWYLFLNNMYLDMPTIVSVLERVLTDQLIYSPISLACFFTYSTFVIDGGDWNDAKSKLRRLYLSTLAFNFCLWFPVQFINFLVMPKKFQVPFSSAIGVLWNCFLSFRSASS